MSLCARIGRRIVGEVSLDLLLAQAATHAPTNLRFDGIGLIKKAMHGVLRADKEVVFGAGKERIAVFGLWVRGQEADDGPA